MKAELLKLHLLIEKEPRLRDIVKSETLVSLKFKDEEFEIRSFTIGSKDPKAPVLFIVGGVHGIERIGAQLAWSLLKTTVDRLLWDRSLDTFLEKIKIVIIPVLNPFGYRHFTRSNANGVDLMRNAPELPVEKVPFLLGGHRFSNKLPWFQGKAGNPETEIQVLIEKFAKETSKSQCIISIDFHSGFGMKDRLWFPYSHKKEPFENLAETHSLIHLFEQSHPYHIYQVEPQSAGYLLKGDVWDYLFDKNLKKDSPPTFIPFTLEMGSWNWVRKNPIQLFSRDGIFNPIKDHRIKRTFRRHHLLFEFLLRALYSHEIWSKLEPSVQQKHLALGKSRWYGKNNG